MEVKILAASDKLCNFRPMVTEDLFCSVQQGDSAPEFVAVLFRPPHTPFHDIFDKLNLFSCYVSHSDQGRLFSIDVI